jgi:teichuronic acid biosynthesis glycosyltransferase TuaG
MNKINPLVSIIIAVYNSENYIRETINTVIAQTYENWELIIVNDGSKDNSERIINEFVKLYSDKIQLVNQINRGPSKARNNGINAAKGDFIAFLDSDDLWHPEKLEKQVRYSIEKNLDICLCQFANFINDKEKTFNREASDKFNIDANKLLEEDFKASILLQKITFTPSSLLLKKEIFKTISFYEKISHAEDLDVQLQCLKKGFTHFACLDECLLLHRLHISNLSSDTSNNIRGLIIAYDRFFENKPAMKENYEFYEKRIMGSIKKIYREKDFATFVLLYKKLRELRTFGQIQFILHLRYLKVIFLGRMQ